MDNRTTISQKKAGTFTCLFLLLAGYASTAQHTIQWLDDPIYQEAYLNCLNLNFAKGRKLLAQSDTPEAYYVSSLADAMELLITEDRNKFDVYEEHYETRISKLKEASSTNEKALFALAEIRLQWAFVHLKFANDFSAAWNVRQAYQLVQECRKKYPTYFPILKTSGVLEIILGSVPEKYHWILSMLGMEGSVKLGIHQMKEVIQRDSSLAFEGTLLTLLIDGFILQQTDSAVAGIEAMHFKNQDNRLIMFLGAALALKNSMSEMAMNLLEKLKQNPGDTPIYYADYLLGEVYLHQGNYSKSIQSYQAFLRNYKGINFVKDAHYKIGVAFWLSNRSEPALQYFELARNVGKQTAEADNYAARALAENTLPNIKLSKIRYSTDGGYYEEALRVLQTTRKDEYVTVKELTEYYYRQARLFHKLNRTDEAKINYKNVIELAAIENWYYAPNSCLQLGYLYANEGNSNEAKRFFKKALTYKKHEYKNSIDGKAKSALEQLD